MEIITEYGYPLLRYTSPGGVYTWYYPQTPDKYALDIQEPRLLEGYPAKMYKDGFEISIFSLKNPSGTVNILIILEISGKQEHNMPGPKPGECKPPNGTILRALTAVYRANPLRPHCTAARHVWLCTLLGLNGTKESPCKFELPIPD